MVKAQRNKTMILGIIIVVGAIMMVFFYPYAEYNSHVQKGNVVYNSENAVRDDSFKMLAYKEYNQAQKEWPFLKYNFWFHKKLSDTQNLIQEYKKTNPALTAFLKHDFTETDVGNLVTELKQNSNVKEVKYISSEEALRIYKQQNMENKELIDQVRKDILPASIEIYLFDWSKSEELGNQLKVKSLIEEVVSLNAVIGLF